MSERVNDELNAAASMLWRERTASQNSIALIYRDFAIKLAKLACRRNRKLDLDDAVSGALMGLAKAISKFDESRSVAFTTFATTHVRFGISNVERENDWVPSTARSEDKRRENSRIPLMLPLGEFDRPVQSSDAIEVHELIEKIPVERHRELVRNMLEQGVEEAAKLSGTSVETAINVARFAMLQVGLN